MASLSMPESFKELQLKAWIDGITAVLLEFHEAQNVYHKVVGEYNDREYFYFVIKHPHLIVTNTKGQAHVIEDLYLVLVFTYGYSDNQCKLLNMSGIRGKMTEHELAACYFHSHLESFDYSDPGSGALITPRSWCLGNTDLSTNFGSVLTTLVNNWGQFRSLIANMNTLSRWESEEGRPHVWIKYLNEYITSYNALSTEVSEINLTHLQIKRMAAEFKPYVLESDFKRHSSFFEFKMDAVNRISANIDNLTKTKVLKGHNKSLNEELLKRPSWSIKDIESINTNYLNGSKFGLNIDWKTIIIEFNDVPVTLQAVPYDFEKHVAPIIDKKADPRVLDILYRYFNHELEEMQTQVYNELKIQ